MSLTQFKQQVTSVDELVEVIGTPGELALRKELKQLDDHMRRFIANSPFVVISTHGADGRCDASPRGDAPGFVHVLDEHSLLIPDRRGNRRVDTFRNLLETRRIGLLFLVPGMGETLRINGRAAIIRDEDHLAPLIAGGQLPHLAIAVEVEECYLQCAKALLRSKLWENHERPDLSSLPCAAEMFADQAQMPEFDAAKLQVLLDGAYQRLY
ncbi:Pyridoxamine 5'-phosphate oxidase [Anatilimnocola aggregata]|uniref:Pyridoxamine 5'-phosphate oxidase n=1 Tax=Anatilimnocola aggregata TaxID=2528021 RepID=A0A517YM32_9BACT|nr:pyridoxamine 5'-phosphate oxidase family protein [Anatilimnocola aggregata]QDU31280.1 Pyridoxamine 5'-phosphate oxidase [Anatilimnocola aggregata]